MIFGKLSVFLVLCALLVCGMLILSFGFLECDEVENYKYDYIGDSEEVLALAGQENSKKVQIAVGVGVIVDFAEQLVVGTDIEIVQAFTNDAIIMSQDLLIESKKFNPQMNPTDITACIGVRSVCPYSSLYRYLRGINIDIIEIDCAIPVERERRSVSLISDQQTGVVYQNIWLSTANALRMIDLISEDLARIASEWKAHIEQNQIKLKQQISDLSTEYLGDFMQYENLDAFALCNEFFYLTSSFQIFVAGRMDDDGREWSEDRLNELKSKLIDNDVHVVIHKWEPHESVMQIIDESGAELIVLDPINKTYVSSYVDSMKDNLGALQQVFANVNIDE